MTLGTEKPGILIETKKQLEEMIPQLQNQAMIGVDTESNSLFEYEERICLIQFSTPDKDYLVDTIKLKDVSSLYEIFASKKIEKIFHAAEYDLMCLKRDFQFEFNNIFDTMISSRVLGFKSCSLQSLIYEYFNIKIEKKFQKANWGIRPLPKEMILYAQHDTHYLLDIRNILYKKLVDANKLDLAMEDFNRLTQVNPFVNNKNNDHYWKILKGRSLTTHDEAVLMNLYFFRETLAKQLNRPPFKVFGNQVILDLVKTAPKNETQLKEIRGLSEKIIQNYGHEILNAISSVTKNTSSLRKEKAKPSAQYLSRYEALKEWRKNKAKELCVESDIVLPKEHLELIAHQKRCELSDIQEIMNDIPYRFTKFGNEIYLVLERS